MNLPIVVEAWFIARLQFCRKGLPTKWFRRDSIRPKSDVSRWCVSYIPQFGSEFAEGVGGKCRNHFPATVPLWT